MTLDIQSFWGKAQPMGDGPGYHPLPLHSLDVAAVGSVLLTSERGPARTLPHLLGISPGETVRVVSCLLALHDVGKFAKRFQAKAPQWFPSIFTDSPDALATQFDHGAGGLRLFEAEPATFHAPPDIRALRLLACAVFGHHGSPPSTQGGAPLIGDFGKPGLAAARLFVGEICDLFGLAGGWPHLDLELARRASYALAGLAVMADWIGSKQEWFPYSRPTRDLAAYWEAALERAASAVALAGVIPSPASAEISYFDLIGEAVTPTPLQEWARDVDLPGGPTLFLLEDETGSGKTEAAAMLAHRLMQSGAGDGLYLALPTMATANAMFDRLAACYRALFEKDATPSIALAHGARDLHAGFRNATLRWGRDEPAYSDDDERNGGDITASAACAAWVADDRRRAFLADVGAGTVDQAIQAILPARHQSLRLLGLMRRVLILDEVHAYDPYMQREIERLLEFQAALGGSAIVLSATLPHRIRNRLAAAFAKGGGEDTHTSDDNPAYPLATMCAPGAHSSTPINGMTGRGRTLPVRFLRRPDDAMEEVARAASADKAVLYIRNTVDDALDAYAALSEKGMDPVLFHARFALADRFDIERNVMATFGKTSRPKNRKGKLLVATQVVEQSLDLDFDVMVTDLAPVDLLIQRAGRLWRHTRPLRDGQPELLVVSPDVSTEPDEQWFSAIFPRAAYVYPDHARLWLTARAIKDAGAITSPGGLRQLVEAVYGPDADMEVPDALQGSFWDAEGKSGADRSVANTNVLDVHTGYLRDGGAWDADIRTPTRLEDRPSTTVRLALLRDGHVVPYADDAEGASWRAWRRSEINVATHRLGKEWHHPQHHAAVQTAKADWGRFEQDTVLVLLDEVTPDGSLCGRALSDDEGNREIQVIYDNKRGLRWT